METGGLIDSIIGKKEYIKGLAVDIETIARPMTEPERKFATKAATKRWKKLKPPSSYKKEETIQKWMETQREKHRQELMNSFMGNALDPFYNQIISWATAYFTPEGEVNTEAKIFKDGEDYTKFLQYFSDYLSGFSSIITVNGNGFDIPTIRTHAIKYNIYIPPCLNANFDIMKYFRIFSLVENRYKTVGLKELTAIFLGKYYESKGEEVGKLYANQEYDTIIKYNIEDAVNALLIAQKVEECNGKYTTL